MVLFSLLLFLLLLVGTASYLVLSCPSVDDLLAANPSTTSLIEVRKRQGKAPATLPSLRKSFVPLRNIPEMFQKTVIVSEDAGFYGHQGIDWFEVKESLRKNIERGHVVRGGSTITQQLAKNLFLSEERSWLRKLREYIIAGKLERALSKRRILELYLNCIEFGRGVFGIGPAAWSFFGKSPGQLALSEMLRLAAVIPEPLRLSPVRPNKSLERRARIILERLVRFGYITNDAFEQANKELQVFFGSGIPADSPGPTRTPEPSAPTEPTAAPELAVPAAVDDPQEKKSND